MKAFLMLLGFLACVDAMATEAVPVKVLTAEVVEDVRTVRSSGQLVNRSEQVLSFKVDGIVKEVKARAGQRVKQGELLATLNLDEMQAQWKKAKALMERSRKSFDRARSLKQQDLISMDNYQELETNLAVAEANFRIAEFNLQHAVIKAPGDGVVLERTIEPNEWIEPGQGAFRFAIEDSGWVVRLGLTDRDALRVNIGDKAKIRLDAYPGRYFDSEVIEISGRADPLNQTFSTELRLVNPPERLLSGLIAHCEIQPGYREQVVMLPFTALLSGDGYKGQVWVLDEENRAQLQQVRIGYLNHGQVAVTEGLEAGVKVVWQGTPYVVANEPVTIVR
ncbi:hypothetical protein BTA51_11295 [Hahella sp. CCB-MM4]|uniref:efflux RND transporter periplasmic adaptor subunit n=1 Tax=Hahella sp. (strain CCB-MM4) TaxID=1926491 RepID=UPI000B9B0AE0|nr:efflux RND transporter periplasmic adaptor subunit [Hahella sp. CCB-MM4]OZG73076.1 hypothetical protein BTA51_11295 [Hahella sp. CCB-MM4]